ncbi:MAG: PAS domain S-box protein [Candidatus Riflebacteria bacterium]|nr:PAS domain S-box protein [Candidatus Riflebacteria bacterium]
MANKIPFLANSRILISTLDSIGDGIVAVGKDGAIEYMNGTAEKITGWSFTETFRKPFSSVFKIVEAYSERPADDFFESIFQSDFEPELVDNNVLMINANLIQKNGSKRTVSCRAFPVFDHEKQELIGMVLVFRDVTEEFGIQEALRASEVNYQNLYEGMHDGIAAFDMNGRIIKFNKAFLDMLGYKHENIYSLSHNDLTPIKWHKKEELIIREQVLKRGHSDLYEKEYKKADGTTINVDLRTYLVRDENNKPLSMWSIVRDITSRKNAANEIKRINSNLEAANKELESFSYSVSHDLRAPLRAINGFSEILIEDFSSSMNDEVKIYIYKIRSSAKRMMQLIDDLLQLSKISRTRLSRTDINLSKLTDEIIETMKLSFPARIFEITIKPDIHVLADYGLLRTTMENLIGNAFKYTGKKELAKIEVGSQITNSEQIVFVKDNGAGFDMKYYEKLFTAFQRLHTNKEFEGTGIGLATVQRIINHHEGRIWAESEPGVGTTFFFTLGPS